MAAGNRIRVIQLAKGRQWIEEIDRHEHSELLFGNAHFGPRRDWRSANSFECGDRSPHSKSCVSISIMIRREQISQVCLWLFVMVLCLAIGGGFYETQVITPVWSGSPPRSVWGWNADPQYQIRSFEKFWIMITPALGVTAAAALLTGLGTRSQHRRWRALSVTLTLVIVVTTYFYFVPARNELFASQTLGLSANEVTSKTNQWVMLNWVRGAVFFVAWIAGLRALSITATETKS